MSIDKTIRIQIEGDGWSKSFDLSPGARAVIGRGPGADVVIERRSVSAQHLAITWSGDEVLIQDLGSSYGTFRMPQEGAFQEARFPAKYEIELRLAKESLRFSWEPLASSDLGRTAVLERTIAADKVSSIGAPSELSQISRIKVPDSGFIEPTPAQSGESDPDLALDNADRDASLAANLETSAVAFLVAAFSPLLWIISYTYARFNFGRIVEWGSLQSAGVMKDLLILWLWFGRVRTPEFLAIVLVPLLVIWIVAKIWTSKGKGRVWALRFATGGARAHFPWWLVVGFSSLIAFAWPAVLGLRFGLGPAVWKDATTYARHFVVADDELAQLPHETLALRVEEMSQMKETLLGSSLLFKGIFDHQRLRILKECDGVGERPWDNKRVCLVLLSAIAIESLQEIQPILLHEAAQRAALLLCLDGITRVLDAEGVKSPFIPFFLGSLNMIGLSQEQEDIQNILQNPTLDSRGVRQILGELRRRIEVLLETQQQAWGHPPQLRLHVPGPLESGI